MQTITSIAKKDRIVFLGKREDVRFFSLIFVGLIDIQGSFAADSAPAFIFSIRPSIGPEIMIIFLTSSRGYGARCSTSTKKCFPESLSRYFSSIVVRSTRFDLKRTRAPSLSSQHPQTLHEYLRQVWKQNILLNHRAILREALPPWPYRSRQYETWRSWRTIRLFGKLSVLRTDLWCSPSVHEDSVYPLRVETRLPEESTREWSY